jgi:RNA polymerase sigma-70 factor (ECF subfamily)
VLNLLRLPARPDSASVEATQPITRDHAAIFEALVDHHYRRVYKLAYRMLDSESDAADATQETFVRAYRALSRLRMEETHGMWLRRIAINVCLDMLRRRKAAPSVMALDPMPVNAECPPVLREIPDPSTEPERLYSQQERKQFLHRAVAALPPIYRTVILLHHLEEIPVDEIAGALGVPGGTIKSRLSRARKALRRKLAPYFELL